MTRIPSPPSTFLLRSCVSSAISDPSTQERIPEELRAGMLQNLHEPPLSIGIRDALEVVGLEVGVVPADLLEGKSADPRQVSVEVGLEIDEANAFPTAKQAHHLRAIAHDRPGRLADLDPGQIRG